MFARRELAARWPTEREVDANEVMAFPLITQCITFFNRILELERFKRRSSNDRKKTTRLSHFFIQVGFGALEELKATRFEMIAACGNQIFVVIKCWC